MTVDLQEQQLQRYLANAVLTASPAQRLLMLFDYLRKDLAEAAGAFEARDWKAVNDQLVHAQEILFALRDPLDRSTELGANLASVYDFCLSQLLTCNLQKDPSFLPGVAELVNKIADANAAAMASAAEGDDPWVLASGVVELEFAVQRNGRISLGAEGELANEVTHTLRLTLLPSSDRA